MPEYPKTPLSLPHGSSKERRTQIEISTSIKPNSVSEDSLKKKALTTTSYSPPQGD
jgi:hypothetical protein